MNLKFEMSFTEKSSKIYKNIFLKIFEVSKKLKCYSLKKIQKFFKNTFFENFLKCQKKCEISFSEKCLKTFKNFFDDF